jgi:hypothetical protein
MHIENYNIHDIISFQLVNDTIHRLLQNFNPEYEYFRTEEKIIPDFRIRVTDHIPPIHTSDKAKHLFEKTYDKWHVQLAEYEDGFIELQIVPKLSGFRNLLSYTALKNIYVRSLIYYRLIKRNSTLIHSSGVSLNDKTFIFAGRPGVFKTSLLMDLLRNTNAKFLGEENILVHNGLAYPFPFHLRSLYFRLKHYKNEDPPTVAHKYLQVLSLFLKNKLSTKISEPAKIDNIFYVEKGDRYKCESTFHELMLSKFVENEYDELNIKCNPKFSLGVKKNFFTDYLHHNGSIGLVRSNLKNLFLKELLKSKVYNLTMPQTYSPELYLKIIKSIST